MSSRPPQIVSEDHDRFSTSAVCHELLHPITLPDRGLYLDAVRIGVVHFVSRTVELILLSHKVVRGERALRVDENSTPLLGHFLKLAQELLLFRFAQRGAWDRHGDSPIESSPISEIRRALEFDPPKTLEHRVRGNCAVRPSGEVHACTVD